ncbi:hypothetical protein HD806DRAFT_502406 [Xylariaceae sp. AK1471]|nr:hypothetical protein HD806DRAFT_502406 [Xylariaceae sp. AK1471]
MLNAEPQRGWGAGTATAPPNPFNSATPAQPGNPFAKPPPNPFFQNNTIAQATAPNPFAASSTTTNPFSAATASSLKRSVSPSFTQTKNGSTTARNPFGALKQGNSTPSSAPSKPAMSALRRSSPGPSTNGSRKVAEFVQPAWPKGSNASTIPMSNSTSFDKRKVGLNAQSKGQNGRRSPTPRLGLNAKNTVPHNVPNNSGNKHDGRSYELAGKIQQQLSKDRIKPPLWPTNPGSHAQRQAMETFRESYKMYREKARTSLIRAGLIDDPDQRRTLEQALDFRGISDEMCPEWEKITRITEYDVRNPEKALDDSGDLVAIPSLMVKRLARSAAGQDAPLPMDVRSFATLRKTLDYLIDDLIPDDSLLPSKHNFLWDRTRAIRIDLSVQKYNLTPDEQTDLVYCLETIARFHVTALHLLSQDGFAAEDFSEQQEIEQLGKTLISLKELYDDCVEQGIECANEAEFRGYYIVFNARNPAIKETVEGWGTRLWNTDGIRTAMCLVESLQNTWTLQGPLNPYAPTELALGAAAMFFSIVSSPQISYTMACFTEIHFNDVRKSMLQVIRRSYSRPRDGPKDITPAFLKERLCFDTEDEAVDFAQKHGLVFGQDGARRYAVLNSRQAIEDTRIRHPFSRSIVERKRSGRALPDIIHRTVYQEDQDESTVTGQEESLFVADAENTSFDTSDNLAHDSETHSLDSTVPSSPPVTVNAQSLDLKNHTPLQSQVANTATSSVLSQTAQTPKLQATTAPRISVSSPIEDANHKPAGSLFNEFHTPSLGKQEDTVKNIDEREQLNADTPTPTQHVGGSATSENKTSIISSSTASPSIFSFLDQDNCESPTLAASHSTTSSPFSASTKPSLLSGNDVGDKPRAAAGSPTRTASSGSLEASSVLTRTQSPKLSGRRSLFEQILPTGASSNDGAPVLGQNSSTFSSKSTSSFLLTEQLANTTTQSAPESGLLTTLSRPELEKSTTVQRTPSDAAPTTMTPKKDPMGNFARWFLLADKGLMENQLEEFAVEHRLRTTWEDFKVAEEERARQEEDEKSWAEALSFRRYSLKVTFFYRWLDIFRKRRVIKRIQLEKEKARKWKSPESVAEREAVEQAKREKAIQEAKELVGKRTKKHTEEVSRMRESAQSRQSLEDALLATGVFSGVRDQAAAARHAAQDDNVDSEGDMFPAEKLRLRSENQRRRRRGLLPLKRFPEAKAYKEGSKTALLRAISSGTGRDSLSMSTGSLRNSTFSSSYRSSLGFNQSRVTKSQSNVTDPYWRLKANGLVQMPNGEYLHESLALPMLQEGKRFPGLGDYGLPPVKSYTPSQSPPAGFDLARDSSDSPAPTRFRESNRVTRSPSILEGITQKRKRGHAEDDDLAAYQNEEPVTRKRAKSSDSTTPATSSADQDFLASIASLLNKVDTVTKSSKS